MSAHKIIRRQELYVDLFKHFSEEEQERAKASVMERLAVVVSNAAEINTLIEMLNSGKKISPNNRKAINALKVSNALNLQYLMLGIFGKSDTNMPSFIDVKDKLDNIKWPPSPELASFILVNDESIKHF